MRAKTPTRPDARAILDTLAEAMHAGIEHFDDAFSLVPGDYEVLLHPHAYEALESIFPYVQERAEVRLNQELDRLNGTAPSLLRRLVVWLKHRLQPAPPAGPRYRPAGYGWRISFSMPLDEAVDVDYLAVVATLAAPPERDDLAGPKTLRLTVRHADGGFKTRTLPAGEPVATTAEAAAPAAVPTRRSRPAEDEASGEPVAGTPLARLSFKDDSGPRTFMMTAPAITIGRGDEQDGVDLHLQTLPDVSREHLRLRYDAPRNTFLVQDVSKYGTTVDGRPVGPGRDPETGRDLDHWEPIPAQTTLGLAGVLFIDFKRLV